MWWWDRGIMFSKHELEDVGMVFPHDLTFANLEFHLSTWLFLHLSVSV